MGLTRIRRDIEAAIVAMSASDGGYKTLAIDAWSIARDFRSPSDLRHLRATVNIPSGRSDDGAAWTHEIAIEVAINSWPGERTTLIGSETVTAEDVANRACKHLIRTLLDLPLDDACILPSCSYTVDETESGEYLLCPITLSLTLQE